MSRTRSDLIELFDKNKNIIEHTNNVIFLFCLRRSGSNAIANFIYNSSSKPKKKFHSYEALFEKKYLNNVKYIHSIKSSTEYSCIKNINSVIMRFENIFLDNMDFNFNNYRVWKSLVGEYSKITYVMPIRDPFNNIASLIEHPVFGKCFKNQKGSRNKRRKKRYIELWKMYAREFLGDTKYIPDNKIFINYNEWVKNIDYRKEIYYLFCKDGKTFDDKNSSILADAGGGSSFSNMEIKNAFKLPLMNRWNRFVDNEMYRFIFKDKELYELSERIFGHIDGTEIFLKGN